MAILNGLFGLALLLGIAVLASRHRRRINWRLVASGFALQFVFALLVLRGERLGEFFAPLAWPKAAFQGISTGFVRLLGFSMDGAKFVFGDLAMGPGTEGSLGYFFAFQALPTIVFFASLMGVLYYLGIMQKVVQAMAWVMARLMGTSGAESLASTANIFVGQTEAPLLIRPFLMTLTQSELLTVMVGGMCTIAGGVMAAYVQMLGYAYAETQGVPLEAGQIRFAAQLLGASIMAAPAGLAISKILLPEVDTGFIISRMLGDIEQQLTQTSEECQVGSLIQHLGPPVILHRYLQTEPRLHVIRKPLRCGHEIRIVQDGWAQLKAQAPGAVVRLGDDFLDLSHALIQPRGFGGISQTPELDAGESQQLAQPVMQVRGEVPALPLLCQSRFGSRSPQLALQALLLAEILGNTGNREGISLHVGQ